MRRILEERHVVIQGRDTAVVKTENNYQRNEM